MDLGRAIIDLCDIRGISQRELANKTGLSKTFHSLLENNHRAPSMETLNKLAKILDVPLYVIFYYATEDSDINTKVLDRYKEFQKDLSHKITSIFLGCLHIVQNYDPADGYNRCVDCGQLVKCNPNNFPV